jgi:hypothetical protein
MKPNSPAIKKAEAISSEKPILTEIILFPSIKKPAKGKAQKKNRIVANYLLISGSQHSADAEASGKINLLRG